MEEKEAKKRSKLGKFLDKRGTTQKWLCDKTRIGEMAMSRYCSGAAMPDSTTWILMANALDVNVNEFFK